MEKHVLKPRPKCTQRNKQFLLDNDHFSQVCQELSPLMYKHARRIYRAHYIKDEDMVQEAFTHIFANREKYDDNLSSIMTWCMKVARNKFLNIAADGFRDKRCPKDEDKRALNPINFEDLLCFSDTEHSSFVEQPSVEDKIHENEIIDRTKKRLNEFACKMFELYISPPPDLIDMIDKRMTAQRARVIHINRQTNNQELHKAASIMSIDNKSMAVYLNVNMSKVAKAKDQIYGALRSAIKDCDGVWPLNFNSSST